MMRGERLSLGLRALGIFIVTLSVTSTWAATEKKLHDFSNFGGISNPDGNSPMGGLISDAAGNLYGTTEHGGDYNGGIGVRVDAHTGAEAGPERSCITLATARTGPSSQPV